MQGATSLRRSPAGPAPMRAAVLAPAPARTGAPRRPFGAASASRGARRARAAGGGTPAAASASAPLQVMITGPPAAGKGTQCARIVDRYGLVHISVGDLLRAEVAAGTPAGRVASERMDRGELVPNEVVVDMVVNRLGQEDVAEKGWLLDGYPRSGDQAEAVAARGIRPDIFLLIDVPDKVLVDRVAGRRLDPETGEIYHLKFHPPPPEIVGRLQQRSDDTEEAILNRLKTHHANVEAVVGYYQDQLVTIQGDRPMDEVFSAISSALDGALAAKAGEEEGERSAATA